MYLQGNIKLEVFNFKGEKKPKREERAFEFAELFLYTVKTLVPLEERPQGNGTQTQKRHRLAQRKNNIRSQVATQ